MWRLEERKQRADFYCDEDYHDCFNSQIHCFKSYTKYRLMLFLVDIKTFE